MKKFTTSILMCSFISLNRWWWTKFYKHVWFHFVDVMKIFTSFVVENGNFMKLIKTFHFLCSLCGFTWHFTRNFVIIIIEWLKLFVSKFIEFFAIMRGEEKPLNRENYSSNFMIISILEFCNWNYNFSHHPIFYQKKKTLLSWVQVTKLVRWHNFLISGLFQWWDNFLISCLMALITQLLLIDLKILACRILSSWVETWRGWKKWKNCKLFFFVVSQLN